MTGSELVLYVWRRIFQSIFGLGVIANLLGVIWQFCCIFWYEVFRRGILLMCLVFFTVRFPRLDIALFHEVKKRYDFEFSLVNKKHSTAAL